MAESYPISGEASTPAPAPAYYAVIPADVRYHPDLPPNAKLLYGEITALCHKEGYCWATNHYFATLYKAHIVTVSKWIRALADAGFIRVDIDKERGNVRHITLLVKTLRPPSEKANTSQRNGIEALSEKAKRNSTENITKNNTRTFARACF